MTTTPSPPEKLHQLIILAELLQSLFTEYQVFNPFEDWLQEQLTADQQVYCPLVLSLSEGFTLLFHRNRVCSSKNVYECSREDVLAALGLLQAELSPLSVISQGARYVYGKLVRQDEKVNRVASMRITGYRKTHMQRLLNELYHQGLVLRSGDKNNGYYYEAIKLSDE